MYHTSNPTLDLVLVVAGRATSCRNVPLLDLQNDSNVISLIILHLDMPIVRTDTRIFTPGIMTFRQIRADGLGFRFQNFSLFRTGDDAAESSQGLP